MPARQILQKSLKWQILAFMNKIKLKTCENKNLLLNFAKNDTGINHVKKKYLHSHNIQRLLLNKVDDMVLSDAPQTFKTFW